MMTIGFVLLKNAELGNSAMAISAKSNVSLVGQEDWTDLAVAPFSTWSGRIASLIMLISISGDP